MEHAFVEAGWYTKKTLRDGRGRPTNQPRTVRWPNRAARNRASVIANQFGCFRLAGVMILHYCAFNGVYCVASFPESGWVIGCAGEDRVIFHRVGMGMTLAATELDERIEYGTMKRITSPERQSHPDTC